MNNHHNNHHDDGSLYEEFELTALEKEALEKLPREHLPNPALEERLVGALRNRGFLAPPRRRLIEFTAWRIAAVATACLLLLAAGFTLGQWVGAHRAVNDNSIVNGTADIAAATTLQQTGSAYLLALQRFVELPGVVDSNQAVQGREVALSTLCAAADQITRLVPKDDLAGQLAIAIDTDPAKRTAERGDDAIKDARVIEF